MLLSILSSIVYRLGKDCYTHIAVDYLYPLAQKLISLEL
jgi:hypothetical protein